MKDPDKVATRRQLTAKTGTGQCGAGGWGKCTDPGATGPKTCRNDVKKDLPNSCSNYDRTAMCNGGSVESWKVNPIFVLNNCQDTSTSHMAHEDKRRRKEGGKQDDEPIVDIDEPERAKKVIETEEAEDVYLADGWGGSDS